MHPTHQVHQRVRIDAAGGPDALRLEVAEPAVPGPGQVWLAQAAIGVNPLDVSQRKGAVPIAFPSGLGLEGAGHVVAVGPWVANVAVGDRVGYATGPLGAYASARLFPAERLVRLPDALGLDEAAAVLFKGITAQYLLKTTYPVAPGSKVLIYGVGGALGQLMCAWARHLGAFVMGVVSRPETVERARAVVFNALVIVFLIPLALKGVRYRAVGAAALLRRNLALYGLGGVVVPFIGIKAIDMVLAAVGLV